MTSAKRLSLTQQAHQQLTAYLHEGDVVIDATAGNGHDTVFLAKAVGESGFVYAFDVQEQAIRSTKQTLEENHLTQNVRIFHACHSMLKNKIDAHHQGEISAIVFNLGYLPGSDKSIITQAPNTLLALESACEVLAPRGLISILIYPGHQGGDQEKERVFEWLDAKCDSGEYVHEMIQNRENTTSPILVTLKRKINLQAR